MITYKDKCFNTWQEVALQYPAMWIVFRQVNFDGTKVRDGNIWEILPDEQIIDFENDHYDDIALSLRTTETLGAGGYIHGELIDAKDS